MLVDQVRRPSYDKVVDELNLLEEIYNMKVKEGMKIIDYMNAFNTLI